MTTVEPPEGPLAEAPVPVVTNWKLFFSWLLGSPALTLLMSLPGIPEPAVITGIAGAIGTAIVCSGILARRLGKNRGAVILFRFFFFGVFGVLSLLLCTLGCMSGGFALNMH